MNTAGAVLLGRQEPTFAWLPGMAGTVGEEVVELADSVGLQLDPWQRLAVNVITALPNSPLRRWLFFEVMLIVSRQNGKGSILEAIEMAWLFLFKLRLIMHSAHLFETSREHFTRILTLIQMSGEYDSLLHTVREGRGAEEIILKGPNGTKGARLKFMTRKGGAGRGFTGDKLVLDECMYLDTTGIQAALPTMATRPDAQVIYAGSAGLGDVSAQMGLVRSRAYAAAAMLAETGTYPEEESALAVLEWAADPAVYNERGQLIGGDDPEDPATHVKANPAYGIRLSGEYIRREAGAFGGYRSEAFGTERLGIGVYPSTGASWSVISQELWSTLVAEPAGPDEAGRSVLAVAGDPERDMSALAAATRQPDGTIHVELLRRGKGTGWLDPDVRRVLAKLPHQDEYDGQPVLVLRNDYTAHVAGELEREIDVDNPPVETHRPTGDEWAAACQGFVEACKQHRVTHIAGQLFLDKAVACAGRSLSEGGAWKLAIDTAEDASPLRAVVLAWAGCERFVPLESDEFGIM